MTGSIICVKFAAIAAHTSVAVKCRRSQDSTNCVLWSSREEKRQICSEKIHCFLEREKRTEGWKQTVNSHSITYLILKSFGGTVGLECGLRYNEATDRSENKIAVLTQRMQYLFYLIRCSFQTLV